MSNWKEKISLRNCSSANIAALCWCGTILAGNLPIAMKTGNYIDLPFNCAFFAHGNLFNDSAAKVARYRCCVIQLDSMDSAGLLFRSSAVRQLYYGYAEEI